jgi:hypothetical protein
MLRVTRVVEAKRVALRLLRFLAGNRRGAGSTHRSGDRQHRRRRTRRGLTEISGLPHKHLTNCGYANSEGAAPRKGGGAAPISAFSPGGGATTGHPRKARKGAPRGKDAPLPGKGRTHEFTRLYETGIAHSGLVAHAAPFADVHFSRVLSLRELPICVEPTLARGQGARAEAPRTVRAWLRPLRLPCETGRQPGPRNALSSQVSVAGPRCRASERPLREVPPSVAGWDRIWE